MNSKDILKKILKKNVEEKTDNSTQFCIKENYHHRIKPKYFEHIESNIAGITYQPDVYDFASFLAEKLGCSYIIDIGCGSGKKLVKLYPQFQIIGIDFGKNIEECRIKFPFGRWIKCNLENSELSKNLDEFLPKSLIICSDVIEHLVNPSNLLKNLKKLMNRSQIGIINTPERDLTRGKNDNGPPNNLHHIREWNTSEFEKLLKIHDLNIVISGLTASSDQNFEKNTMFFILSNNNKNEILKKLNYFDRKHTKIIKRYP